MSIEDMLINCKESMPDFLANYCIISGNIRKLEYIQNMGYDMFGLEIRQFMPKRLYKYFPNTMDMQTGINYSIEALKNNTVFMQTPTEFDDIYDSDIYVDWQEYERIRLEECCRRCQILLKGDRTTENLGNALIQQLVSHWDDIWNEETNMFIRPVSSEIEELSNQLFVKNLKLALLKEPNIAVSLKKVLSNEYQDYVDKLKRMFRISCFTTTPYSQLMWGNAYANYHKGFCIEYSIDINDEWYKRLSMHVFPLIYCKVRPDVSEKIVRMKEKLNTLDNLWILFFHGALRKSIDWAFQDEWRLLLSPNSEFMQNNLVKFFPITRVFLGNRMEYEDKKKIIAICNANKIPYIGLKRSPKVFEMEECPVLCENCINYQK